MNANQYSNVSKLQQNVRTTEVTQIVKHYEAPHELQWCYMQPQGRPCFNMGLMEEFHEFYTTAQNDLKTRTHNIRYRVLASNVPGVFNLGGDLQLFKKMILEQDLESLKKYALICIEALYARATMHKKGVTEISLVQGDALGGGFESAIAADVVIAETQSKFGLPDVLFNSFPGIGAYTFLSRKVGPSIAERIILSGKLYSAEELHELGIIDIIVDEDQGESAVYSYISKANRCNNTIDFLRKARNMHFPINYGHLEEIAISWAENAMRISGRDLRMIDRLISKQNSTTSHAA